jgi:hypothetical protein
MAAVRIVVVVIIVSRHFRETLQVLVVNPRLRRDDAVLLEPAPAAVDEEDE